jgi:NTE family protein
MWENKMPDVVNRRQIEAGQEGSAHAKNQAQKQRQVILVFQGGGALGAYQAGVYQALHESAIEPDWIIGTSIGAINASLIVGNEPEDRLDRLEEFWRRMRRKEFWGLSTWPGLSDTTAYWSTLLGGIPGFFEPNPFALLSPHYPLSKDNAGFYSTAPLEKTLPSWSILRLSSAVCRGSRSAPRMCDPVRCATSTAARRRSQSGM